MLFNAARTGTLPGVEWKPAGDAKQCRFRDGSTKGEKSSLVTALPVAFGHVRQQRDGLSRANQFGRLSEAGAGKANIRFELCLRTGFVESLAELVADRDGNRVPSEEALNAPLLVYPGGRREERIADVAGRMEAKRRDDSGLSQNSEIQSVIAKSANGSRCAYRGEKDTLSLTKRYLPKV